MSDARRSRGHWLVLAGAGLALAALAVLGLWLEPSPTGHGTHTQLGLPPCMTMELFGVPCPGCGVTTAAAWAARGELGTALRTQPFGALAALALALFPVWALAGVARGRDLGERAPAWLNRYTFGAASLVALGAWIYRLIALTR